MDIDLEKGTVTIYEVQCRLCKRKVRSPTKEGCHQTLINHVDNDCEIAKTMREWNKRGIYKEMMSVLHEEAIEKDVQKLVKKYGFDKVKKVLDELAP